MVELIDRKSLLRQIKVRQKWHGELDADEVVELIRQAPEIKVHENCTKDAREAH